MTLTVWGPCPECGEDAAWTTQQLGTGHTAPSIDCKCQERVVPANTQQNGN